MNANIIHELRPMSLGPRELLYQEGDEAKEIYFIQQGRVKVYVDLNNHISDRNLLSIIVNIQREKETELALLGESLPQIERPSMRAIIQYIEGGHIGDADVCRNLCGQILGSLNRDTYAFTGNQDVILFQMNYKEIMKIKDTYPSEWNELMETGVRRHKNHQILIRKEVKSYVINLKMNLSDYISDDDQEENQPDELKDSDLFLSENSDIISEMFHRAQDEDA